MHLLHYVRNFNNPLGGTEQFVKGLTAHLDKYGIRQSILTNSTNARTSERVFEKDIVVFALPSRTSGAYQILKGLHGFLKESEYDIINIHGYGEYAGDVICILRKLRRIQVPVVLTTHGSAGLKHAYLALDHSFFLTPHERISRLIHLLYDFTLGRIEVASSDKIIVSSQDEKKYLSNIGLKPQDVLNIPLGINDVFFASGLGRSERKYILYVGRIERFKGIDTLVKAIKELRLSNTEVKCMIVGKDVGFRAQLEMLINDLRIQDIVEIKDQVSQAELVNIYSSAIVTVLASSSEGFGLSVVESMASGTPFIATPVGSMPEHVKISNAGMLVPVGNPIALASSIRNLLTDTNLWYEMSAKGKLFAENFRWDKIANRFYELYVGLTSFR